MAAHIRPAADRLDRCNHRLSSNEILNRSTFGRAFRESAVPQDHERDSQQNVMQISESAVLRRGSFPCRPAIFGVIVAGPSWFKQAERRVDHIQAQDAGADVRRSAWMAAAQAGDASAYQALLRDCVPIIKSVARRRGAPIADMCGATRYVRFVPIADIAGTLSGSAMPSVSPLGAFVCG